MSERLELLRKKMAERGMDAYLVPSGDFHLSEFTEEFFKCKEFLTGFHGAEGTAVVTMTDACLWTTAGYWDEANEQLAGTEWHLMNEGEPTVPSIAEYLEQVMPEAGILGFDGRVVSSKMGDELLTALKEKHVHFACDEDVVDLIWEDRPGLSMEPVWILEERYAGRSAADKIQWLRGVMDKMQAQVYILTALEDISWLFNLRANDTPCNPVVRAYTVMTAEQVFLFIEEQTVNDHVKSYLEESGVTLCPYDGIYGMVQTLQDVRILLQSDSINFALMHYLLPGNTIIDKPNPTVMARIVKNPTEVENMRKAHIKDGTAMTKFIYWLKRNVGREKITEISAAHHLDELRADQDGYLGISFRTMSAYREHASSPHYFARPETNLTLKREGLYMVDSGGQYYEGTTDITRTIALGTLTEEEREQFTLVVISMLRLADAKFLYGCRGMALDYAAREPLWRRGFDYSHGTGHGVGFVMNIHEAPNGIRYAPASLQSDPILEEGMICSDEPGLYFKGRHGMRMENLIVCRKGENNQFGQFMEFEHLTMVPIDVEALNVNMMEQRDIDCLNAYHREVYEKIAPHLNTEEAQWLEEVTKPIQRRK